MMKTKKMMMTAVSLSMTALFALPALATEAVTEAPTEAVTEAGHRSGRRCCQSILFYSGLRFRPGPDR